MIGYVILGVLVFGAIATVWRGYVLSVVWGWFIVERFGLPTLSVAQAIGIALVVSALTHRHIPSQEGKGGEAIADMVFAPLMILAVAWIVRGFL